MIYRLAKIEDVEQIDALCKRENLALPQDGTTYVADDNGKIIGFISFTPIHFVNCFVSDSAIASNVLYEKMSSVLEAVGAKRVMMIAQNSNIEDLALTKEFVFTNEVVNVMEKKYG